MSVVIPPDLELWLCSRIRERLVGDDYDGGYPLVVVRDDGGDQTDRVLFDRSVGVTVRYGSRKTPKPCRDIAARIYGFLTDPAIALLDGSPIAAVEESGCNGPYPVSEDADVARYYMALEFAAMGELQ